MNAFVLIMIWLLPGSVLALHQGLDHMSGHHIPKVVIFDWEFPHWLTYLLVLLLGPFLMLAVILDMALRRS